MKIPEILFEDIIVESKYNLFKLIFKSHDMHFSLDLNEEDIPSDFDIEVNEVVFSKDKIYFENTNQEYVSSEDTIEIKRYNFFKDYFSLAVKKIPHNYMRDLQNYLKEKSIYGSDAKKDFYNLCIDNLKEIYTKIEDVSFLSKKEEGLLIEQIAHCQDCVSSLKLEMGHSQKIPFTLNNKELTTLFYLLRNGNVIDKKMNNPELGDLMQNHLYYNNVKPLIRASKYLYSLDKGIDDKTLDKLRDSFRDIFFK